MLRGWGVDVVGGAVGLAVNLVVYYFIDNLYTNMETIFTKIYDCLWRSSRNHPFAIIVFHILIINLSYLY